MPFWAFGNLHGKKREERLKPGLRPASSNGHGANYSVSTLNLLRPSLGSKTIQQHQPPPLSRPWNGPQGNPYGNSHATVSRPNITTRPSHSIASPYGHQSYGPPAGQMIQCSSPPNPPNTIYPSQNQTSNQQSSLHMPSAMTGGLHKASKSVTDLNARYFAHGAALYDRLSSKLDTVITCMDEEKFSGDERDLCE